MERRFLVLQYSLTALSMLLKIYSQLLVLRSNANPSKSPAAKSHRNTSFISSVHCYPSRRLLDNFWVLKKTHFEFIIVFILYYLQALLLNFQ
jgi:hypothetical protein